MNQIEKNNKNNSSNALVFLWPMAADKNGIHLTASDFLLINLPPVSSSSSDEKLAETKRLNPVT